MSLCSFPTGLAVPSLPLPVLPSFSFTIPLTLLAPPCLLDLF